VDGYLLSIDSSGAFAFPIDVSRGDEANLGPIVESVHGDPCDGGELSCGDVSLLELHLNVSRLAPAVRVTHDS